MQIIDVYTKKEYECKICKGKVYYAKVANDKGELYTIDNLTPNGKFGKDSNVLTCQVDTLVKDQVHKCQKNKINEKIQELDDFKEKPAIQNAQANPNVQEAPSPLKVKEMTVTDFAEPALRKEIQNNLKILKIEEEEVIKFIGTDARGDKVGMWMKLIRGMMEKK